MAADLARRAGHRPPLALSLGFPDPACDERVIQTSVASALATPLHLAPFFEAAGPRGLLGEGLALNAGLSAPLFNNWMPAYLSLVRYARRRDVTVLFTGEGGDEWLGATPFFGADLLRLGRIGGLVRMARTWKRSFRQDWLTVLRGTLWRYSLRPLAGLWCHRLAPDWWDERRARKVSRATPDWISPDPALRALQHVRARAGLAPADPPGGFYSRESRLFLDDPLTTRLFEEQHELVRELGVRFVHPYWDPDLVAHMYRVRPERLNEHDRSKAVVRQTLARRFPQLGFERQRKVAALGFFTSILRRDAPALGAQVADFSGLAGLSIVQPDAARRFLDRAWGGTAREMGEAWNLVNTEVWIRAQQQRLPEQPQRKDESR